MKRAPSTTTRAYWNMPSTVPVVTVTNAGNIAENGVVRLLDPSGVLVDQVSWGTNTTAFSPAAPVLRIGHSLSRTTILSDNNVASDWSDGGDPSPGN